MYTILTPEQNRTLNVEHTRHVLVGQTAAATTNKTATGNATEEEEEIIEEEYNFTIFSFINITFGLLDGGLNTMPRGGLL